MEKSTRIALGGMADNVLDLAERLISVGEELNKLAGSRPVGDGVAVADEGAWMAEAERELAALIRWVEAPKQTDT